MSRIGRWLVAILTLLFGRAWRWRQQRAEKERIIPAEEPAPRAEIVVAVLLVVASLFAIGFVVAYALFGPEQLPNELLGVCLGLALACIGAAFAVVAKNLVVTEELEGEYPSESPEAREELTQLVHESGSKITRKKLLVGAGTAAAGTLGLAVIAPAVSIGPIWDTGALDESPWRSGQRLVDEENHPFLASDIEGSTFYTAFPEGADKEKLGSPVVVVRLNPDQLHLPSGRQDWAPYGIVAYSKICTHAACAIALYRKPTFGVVEPQPALICPCHYSTFDPARGAAVIYGPAGRPLPQLPLMVGADGYLRAAGNFSERVGPSWWNVRSKPS